MVHLFETLPQAEIEGSQSVRRKYIRTIQHQKLHLLQAASNAPTPTPMLLTILSPGLSVTLQFEPEK